MGRWQCGRTRCWMRWKFSSLNRSGWNGRVNWRCVTNGHKFDDDDLRENDRIERINGTISRIATVGGILVFRICQNKFDAMEKLKWNTTTSAHSQGNQINRKATYPRNRLNNLQKTCWLLQRRLSCAARKNRMNWFRLQTVQVYIQETF